MAITSFPSALPLKPHINAGMPSAFSPCKLDREPRTERALHTDFRIRALVQTDHFCPCERLVSGDLASVVATMKMSITVAFPESFSQRVALFARFRTRTSIAASRYLRCSGRFSLSRQCRAGAERSLLGKVVEPPHVIANYSTIPLTDYSRVRSLALARPSRSIRTRKRSLMRGQWASCRCERNCLRRVLCGSGFYKRPAVARGTKSIQQVKEIFR